MQTVSTQLLIATLCFVIDGCSSFKVVNVPSVATHDDWVQFGGGAARQNRSDERMELPIKKVWEYGGDAGFSAFSAVAEGDYILAGDLKGLLHVINVKTGEGKDVRDFGSALIAPPIVDGMMVYLALPDDDENLVAYDFADNTYIWKLRVEGIENSPLLFGDMLYAVTREGDLLAIDKLTGALRWTYTERDRKMAGQSHSSPAGNDSVIVFGRDNGTVVAVNRNNGMLKWNIKAATAQMGTPTISGNSVFVGSTDSTICSLDLGTGVLQWSRRVGGRVFSGFAAGDRNLYAGTASGLLIALDMKSGNTVWHADGKNGFGAAPLLAGSLLFAGNLDKSVTAFDATTGAVKWSWTGEGRVKATPVIHHQTLVILQDNRTITGFRAEGDATKISLIGGGAQR